MSRQAHLPPRCPFQKGTVTRPIHDSLPIRSQNRALPPRPHRPIRLCHRTHLSIGSTLNGDIFEKTHDELDFEFLGNIRGKRWRFQTNVYGNGSTSRGREERYTL
ncbi:putative xyloglucan endotransglucosylase/hydrolase protein 30 [Camellia lanceoleosa]|uniref:Xyloglucan endotransglucosylase/hydrolase protein 30 n=1 Tax=Camellia lanceoleosa TaxID=1840588 RepID=A0ACC0J6K3_9ERIC|nr:putative xyloglucan endotransglucosylase/hydrolase protein 30 [Camellia lanceoleosa]